MNQSTPPGKSYRGEGVTVHYDAGRCVHFAECVRGLPEVFDPGRRPWILASQAPAERVADVVRRCPSGALHYVLDGGPAERPETPTTVRVADEGPLLVRGDLRLQGQEQEDGGSGETRAALCACGASANRPFCDRSGTCFDRARTA
ncbi:(4Fe-4S)-binding protein [Streptomyces sp. NPDC047108]|uniref:(4Fe-4S)-binding protein n=1 Tax=Streptomyces sp. NPDC047108 TaxID=3155025 RepID=UPI003411ACF6